MASYLVTPEWLYDHLHKTNMVIADCRFILGQPESGLEAYRLGHIPGALYFHLERDLSGPVQPDGTGGRHPLPSVEQMTDLFSRMGIDESVTVVAYDDQDLAMASRLWWMLSFLGHQRVYVLNGGFQAWKKAGYPVNDEIPAPAPRSFVPRLQEGMVVTLDDVLSRDQERTILIDSRAPERYRGEVETIDRKAGHIPGALSYFFKENLRTDGTMKSAEELRERFATLPADKELIVYCGSGVTACVNLLALHETGRTDARLYAGSWSEYSSRDLPVATGDESQD